MAKSDGRFPFTSQWMAENIKQTGRWASCNDNVQKVFFCMVGAIVHRRQWDIKVTDFVIWILRYFVWCWSFLLLCHDSWNIVVVHQTIIVVCLRLLFHTRNQTISDGFLSQRVNKICQLPARTPYAACYCSRVQTKWFFVLQYHAMWHSIDCQKVSRHLNVETRFSLPTRFRKASWLWPPAQ